MGAPSQRPRGVVGRALRSQPTCSAPLRRQGDGDVHAPNAAERATICAQGVPEECGVRRTASTYVVDGVCGRKFRPAQGPIPAPARKPDPVESVYNGTRGVRWATRGLHSEIERSGLGGTAGLEGEGGRRVVCAPARDTVRKIITTRRPPRQCRRHEVFLFCVSVFRRMAGSSRRSGLDPPGPSQHVQVPKKVVGVAEWGPNVTACELTPPVGQVQAHGLQS